MDLAEAAPQAKEPPQTGDLETPEQCLAAADALLGEGRLAALEALLQAGLQRFPDHDWVATAYGELLNRQGRWAEAVEEWTRQVALFPEHPPAYGGLAVALEQTGKPEAAFEVLGRGAARCPHVDWLRARHAHAAYGLRRDWRDAAVVWAVVAADFPDAAFAVVEQARALRAAGDPAAALQVLEAALETRSDQAAVQVGVLENLLDLGEVARALAVWRKLYRRHGDSGVVPYDQSWRLFVALESDPARAEPLDYLFSEPDTGRADWRPVLVERVQVLTFADFAKRVRTDVLKLLGERTRAETRTLLHRMLWSLLGGALTAAEAEANLRTALQRAPWVTQILVENWAHRERTPVYAEACGRVLPAEVSTQLAAAEPGHDIVLQSLKIASIFHAPTFDELLDLCARRPPAAPPDPGTAAAAVAATVRAYRPAAPREPTALARLWSALAASRRTRSRPRPLRIAVCISGQMRGYRDAFPSWSSLGLEAHEAHYFVHTWKRLGGRPPDLAHAYRSFEPAFAAAYIEAAARLGGEEMERRYPHLVGRGKAGDQREVDAEEVRALYGAVDVRIDDEADVPFAGQSNFWKMHYKIRQAHGLALASRIDFDLFIRVRPDREIASASIDWRAVAERCAAENLVYADEGRSIQSLVGYYMGDQFAVGAPAGMDAYARTFDFVEAGGVFGVPPDHVPHGSLALKTFHSGVRVELMPELVFGEHRNASRMRLSEVEALLRADLGSRPPDEIDRALLRGCGAAD